MYNPESEKFTPPTENPPPYHGMPFQQPPLGHYPPGQDTTEPAIVVLAQPISGQHRQMGVTQTIVIGQMPLGQNSQRLICQYCQADVTTITKPNVGVFAHLVALCLCVFGCCPCCLLPYCMEDCHDVEHTCPNCERFIGHYKRI